MDNFNLNFIKYEDLYSHVENTVKQYRFEINFNDFNKNIIDPIKLTFDSKIYNKDILEVLENEILRQIDKSNTNLIGYFHQNIFKYMGDFDWQVPTHGFDVINEKKKFMLKLKINIIL